MPLAKAPGAALAAGTLNLEQPLVMRVERAGAETRAAAIARLVERAAASRPRLVAAADRSRMRSPGWCWRSRLLAGLHSGDGWVAIAVLVATCPCALALAAPVALTRATGELLARGVALTRASALETLAAATDVVLDKTGTLTAGHFRIARVELLGAADEARMPRARAARWRRPAAIRWRAPSTARIARAVDGCARTSRAWASKRALAGRRVRIGTEAFCRELARRAAAGCGARSRR